MSTFAAIFPGQGAQLVGMGKDIADAHNTAAETFSEADAVLGFSISSLCFDGPEDKLGATDIQQPAIFATSVAIFRAAVDAGLFKPDDFAAMGGLSLGEYTALHLAGAVSFADALRLVARRGQLMQQAAEATSGGMVSLIGAKDEDKVLALCERVTEHGRVKPANFNCPGQIVISGDRAACEAAEKLADEFGFRAVSLPVAGAFHSEHMQPAADGLKEVLDSTEFRAPSTRVISNVTADYHSDPASIRDLLVQQVVSPVRWQACVERLITDGCSAFYEVGPNRHLSGMMRKIDRKMKTTNVSTVGDLTPTSA